MVEVKIIGTSHISKDSANAIRKAYEEFSPDVLAVELDHRRLKSLEEERRGKKQSLPLSMVRQVGTTGYLFLVVGRWLQRKLAGIVNVQPGIDMLSAIDLAREHKKKLLLVDQDVLVTMQRMRKGFTFREKLRMLGDVLMGPFKKEKISVRLDKVPPAALIKKLMGVMQERYPGLHKALVTDRNVHMCVRLDMYARAHPTEKILLVIGAGHEEDIRSRLTSSSVFSVQ